MEKIKSNFIINQYRSGIDSYSDFTKEVGLWKSEEYVFRKYLKKTDRILDLGCGTGRTSFPLYKEGFNQIVGVDLTAEMIDEANILNTHFNTSINFIVGDAKSLDFKDSSFDSIIFSFNGLMSIPNQNKRDAALTEIGRIIIDSGIFIFTTHDRDKESSFIEFWKEEKERWLTGRENKKLYEYGDIITKSKNESREIFIHIPSQNEIVKWLDKFNFEVIETFYRCDKFEESQSVKSKSGECRFWVTRKKN